MGFWDGSGVSWTICWQFAPHTEQITTPTPHHSSFRGRTLFLMLSVLWCCWLHGRKGIHPVKNWAVGCWHGYLSGARCRLACHCHPLSLASVKSRLVLPFWYRLTWVVPEKRAVKRVCVCVCTLLLTPNQQCQSTEGKQVYQNLQQRVKIEVGISASSSVCALTLLVWQ